LTPKQPLAQDNQSVLTALLHRPSSRLQNCELTFLPSRAIDSEKAARQHRFYGDMLRRCGVEVVVLDANPHLPDSVFVEDTALVLDEIALITPMGTSSRRAETDAIEAALRKYRPVARIPPPARIEGGDVLRIGRTLYVGLSTRTNAEGLEALEALVAPHGYAVRGVRVTGCLHLKTGCTALDDHSVLINPAWVDPAPLEGLEQINVPPEEPFAANILRIDGTLCIHSGFEETWQMLGRRGYRVENTDISEFLKAEAGLTCMSL
jgi:dimethylargininase